MSPKDPATWLFDWYGCLIAGLIGHGWKTPKGWIAYDVEEKRQAAERRRVEGEAMERRLRRVLAPVPPVVYHGDTPSKEALVMSMDDLPNPTSVIYLYVVEENGNGEYRVMRASSENPTVPNLSNEECEDADDFGTFETSERALAVAKKLNDEERARRFA